MIRCFVPMVTLITLFALGFPLEAQPVKPAPRNPYVFQDSNGQPLVLIGAYTWGTFSGVDYDYEALFDTLQAHGLNFARIWVFWGHEAEGGKRVNFVPYQRSGPGAANDGLPKHDLTKFDAAFFERLHSMCEAAGRRGIHVQLILFDAWMLKHAHLWRLHAFHRDNNVNGVDGDPRNTGTGTDGKHGFCSLDNPKVLAAQEALIRKVVDTVNEFDNVIFEIANENFYNADWEVRLCEFIHDYERHKPKQHLAMPKDLPNHKGVVQTWDPKAVHAAMMQERRLLQPLIFDTDWDISNNDAEVRRAMWAAVLSGGHFNYMDDSFQIGSEHHGDYRGSRRADLHRQIGYLAAFARQSRLWEMQPDDALVKAGNAFAMASTSGLAAYVPTGGRLALDLSKFAGELEAYWFDPVEGRWETKLAVRGGGAEEFTAPNGNDRALLLRTHRNLDPPAGPVGVRTVARAPSSIQVSWRAAGNNAGVAGYRVFRNGTQIAATVLPSCTDFGLAAEKSYAYTVSAFDLSGNESPPSAASTALTSAPAAFCRVTLGAEDTAERLKHVADPDGDTRPAKVAGRDCREPASAEDHYFYFAVDDGYLYNEAGLTVRLEVSYFDDSGFIQPHYDSLDNAYTSARRIDLTGTGQWKTATWMLSRCKFANRQNAGADLRLFVGPNPVKVASLKLAPMEENSTGFGIHPRSPNHFVYRGQPFFFVGKSAFALIDADWRAFVDEAQRDGFSVLRVWLCCPALTKKHGRDHFQRNQAAGDVWPFGGTPANPDFSGFNQDYFRRLDAILDYLEAKGMVAELTLFAGGDFWPGGPYTWDEVKQRYVQFVLDRYANKPNLYYEIANEYYSAEGQAFVEKAGDFIWERDQRHLVTASAGDIQRFSHKAWYRLHSFHASRGSNWWTRVYEHLLLSGRQTRMPLVSDEPMGSRAEDDQEQGYPGRDSDGAHHRMNFWITAMGKGHITFHSAKGINALVGGSPGQEFVKPFREFFEQVRFWELEPAPEMVKGGAAFVLAAPTESVVYLPKGGKATLDLTSFHKPLTARWFNPRKGGFNKEFKVLAQQTAEFGTPDGNDWALLLQTPGNGG